MTRRIILFSTILILCASFCLNQEKSQNVIAIKGAYIIPVVGEDIPEGAILIKNGKIEAVGKNVTIPQDAKIIDAKGLFAYPGMIDSFSYLGLQEIYSIRATMDSRETGDINPQVKTVEALRPDSVHIPIARANGITAAVVAPAGGLIAGQCGLIRLVGRTPDEMIIKSSVALHIQFHYQPQERVKELKKLLNKARYYQKRKEAAQKNMHLPLPEFDEKLEFLLPVVNGKLPLMISVYADKNIKTAVKFIKEEKLKAIFFGVTEGWKVVEEIKESGIPVVFGSLYAMPSKWEDGYDAVYRNPGVLAKAGVKFAFSSEGPSVEKEAKDLPEHAAKSAAFGLDKKEALKGVTIYPAQIFGVDDIMGSLEKGKTANIVLTDGDILELATHIKHVFIDGKEMDLSNRYTELIEKFKKRY